MQSCDTYKDPLQVDMRSFIPMTHCSSCQKINDRVQDSMKSYCQGMTCFSLQKHLGVFPTPTSDTFSILWTLTASESQRHFGILLIPSPFQQSPTLLRAPSTLTPHLTPPPNITLRPPPPLKVAQRPLQTPYPPIRTPLRHSSETLQVIAEIRQLP